MTPPAKGKELMGEGSEPVPSSSRLRRPSSKASLPGVPGALFDDEGHTILAAEPDQPYEENAIVEDSKPQQEAQQKETQQKPKAS